MPQTDKATTNPYLSTIPSHRSQQGETPAIPSGLLQFQHLHHLRTSDPTTHGRPTNETNDQPTRNPTAHHSTIPVPLHWQDDVKAGLDRDVRLGVLEPVPNGEPVTWCHRMVICTKKNGIPRRTIDFQPLNIQGPTREEENRLRRMEWLPQCTPPSRRPTLYHLYHSLGPLQIQHSPSRLHCLR